MKINSKILSIPPYISTAWDNVFSLQFDTPSNQLVVLLKNGARIFVPNLTPEDLDTIFSFHSEFLEKGSKVSIGGPPSGGVPLGIAQLPFPNGALGPITGVIQHDPSQKDGPPIPKEVLDKITHLTSGMGIPPEAFRLLESEPHCNCPYCQIARTMSHSLEEPHQKEGIEEEVSSEELKFREWDIKQVGENLYHVSNPFDKEEHYQVFLGTPVGCTCGKNNCQHIIAVLNS